VTDIAQLSKWNLDISMAIAALGTEQVFPARIGAIVGQLKVNYPQGWLTHKDLPPSSHVCRRLQPGFHATTYPCWV